MKKKKGKIICYVGGRAIEEFVKEAQKHLNKKFFSHHHHALSISRERRRLPDMERGTSSVQNTKGGSR